jgi:hypothetical protein
MQTPHDDPDEPVTRLPKKLVTDGWWLSDPQPPVTAAVILPFRRPRPAPLSSIVQGQA